jgi:ATP-dependent Clp protease ATP-binding subunit ClpX
MGILVEPNIALVKQYQRVFKMENVELALAEDALWAISWKAIERRPGRVACVRSWRS